MIYTVSLRFQLLFYNCPYSSIFLILHIIDFHSTYNLVDSSHHAAYKESFSPCSIQSILVMAPKYHDTSYFSCEKVQLLPSKLSASEFYFTSNNLMFGMRLYRVMWLVLLPAVWSWCETFFLLWIFSCY